MFERRKRPRGRTLLGAEVAHNPQYAPVRCVVRNLSESGARLALNSAVVLPAEIDLTITQRAETRRARLVWRRGDAVGVAFVRPETAAAPIPLDLVRRLRDSEAEVHALRRRLALLGEGAETASQDPPSIP